jgi:hypothetical protein
MVSVILSWMWLNSEMLGLENHPLHMFFLFLFLLSLYGHKTLEQWAHTPDIYSKQAGTTGIHSSMLCVKSCSY